MICNNVRDKVVTSDKCQSFEQHELFFDYIQ